MDGREASPASRQAALTAAAALIGPAIPGGIVNRKPGEAATAVITLAELFLPWLEGTEAAAATAAAADPGTGDSSGSTRPGPEED